METKTTEITFSGLLTCIFIALKLMGNITWSWWWVLMPTLAQFILGLIILIILGIISIIEE